MTTWVSRMVHRTSEGNKCPGTGKKPGKITAHPGGTDGVCSVCRKTWVVSGGVMVPHWSNGQCPGGGTKPAVGLAPVATHNVPGLDGVGFVEVSGSRSTSSTQTSPESPARTSWTWEHMGGAAFLIFIIGLFCIALVQGVAWGWNHVQETGRFNRAVGVLCEKYRLADGDTSKDIVLPENLRSAISFELNQAVLQECPDASAPWLAERNEATVSTPLSDCDQRIFEIGRYPGFTDEQERELIRGIRDEPACQR